MPARAVVVTPARRPLASLRHMAEFDPEAMIQRFADRAASVKRRQIPPVEGEARREFVRQAETDFTDFALLGDAAATIEDGILVLRVDLRPPDQRS